MQLVPKALHSRCCSNVSTVCQNVCIKPPPETYPINRLMHLAFYCCCLKRKGIFGSRETGKDSLYVSFTSICSHLLGILPLADQKWLLVIWSQQSVRSLMFCHMQQAFLKDPVMEQPAETDKMPHAKICFL